MAVTEMVCSYCGGPTSRIHSGRPECGSCWDWRKLDGPAARHWAKVSAEFLSNVDYYDLSKFFAKCGLTDEEAATMLQAARKVQTACEEMLEAHR